MKLIFLGSAGAAPSQGHSEPFNCFFLKEPGMLVEAPPDALVSLGQAGIPIQDIRSIFVSHLHGDHVFGLPFLFLAIRRAEVLSGKAHSKETNGIPKNQDGRKRIALLGPAGTGKAAVHLTELAFGEGSSTLKWLHERVMFIPLEPGMTPLSGPDCSLEFREMDHPVTTLGFALWKSGSPSGTAPLLSYIPDTLWCPGAEALTALDPNVLIADMGGGPEPPRDKPGTSPHMTASEALQGISRAGKNGGLVIGTHLDRLPESMVQGVIRALSSDDCELSSSSQDKGLEGKDSPEDGFISILGQNARRPFRFTVARAGMCIDLETGAVLSNVPEEEQ